MKTLRPLLLTVFFLQFASAQTTFNKPSEAYKSARRPLTEWESAVKSHTIAATPTAPEEEVRQRFRQLCPLFSIKDESGEELYWLAKLCEADHEKALTAIALYLSGSELTHAADARWLLATQQMRKTGNWESSWPTIKLIGSKTRSKNGSRTIGWRLTMNRTTTQRNLSNGQRSSTPFCSRGVSRTIPNLPQSRFSTH